MQHTRCFRLTRGRHSEAPSQQCGIESLPVTAELSMECLNHLCRFRQAKEDTVHDINDNEAHDAERHRVLPSVPAHHVLHRRDGAVHATTRGLKSPVKRLQ